MNKYNFYLLGFYVLLIISCKTEEPVYNPCLQNFRTDDFKPSNQSLDWIPYNNNQELVFKNNSGDEIKFKKTIHDVLVESLHSKFKIICPNDSMQTSNVSYTTFEYQNEFRVIKGQTSLISIGMELDVLLDELNSNRDDAKLADVLKISFKIKTNGTDSLFFYVLQFPVLDRGFKDALSSEFLYSDSLVLNNRTFYDVYSNFLNNEHNRVYYSFLGLVGFEIEGELFTISQ